MYGVPECGKSSTIYIVVEFFNRKFYRIIFRDIKDTKKFNSIIINTSESLLFLKKLIVWSMLIKNINNILIYYIIIIFILTQIIEQCKNREFLVYLKH